jgi:membrane protease subunit (stomatin/prohibitin family)
MGKREYYIHIRRFLLMVFVKGDQTHEVYEYDGNYDVDKFYK